MFVYVIELVEQYFGDVVDVLGGAHAPLEAIVKAIRKSNYDANQAIAYLFDTVLQ